MDQPRDYAVGYGKPPVETRFQKGQSGNPQGRPRGTKKLVTLLGDVLSPAIGIAETGRLVDDEAEAIFFSLASQASTPDLKAKKLLFDVTVKLQQANICHPSDGLPEIALDDGQTAEDAVSAEIDRVAAAIGRDTARPAQMASERPPEACAAESAPEVTRSPDPPR
jgi:hypothetical protein